MSFFYLKCNENNGGKEESHSTGYVGSRNLGLRWHWWSIQSPSSQAGCCIPFILFVKIGSACYSAKTAVFFFLRNHHHREV
jgi:hypothetical protein